MKTKIFLNHPVKDVQKSITFFTKLGYTPDANFSNEHGASMIISDTISLMLMAEPLFKMLTAREVADNTKGTESFVTLCLESRAEVDTLVDNALAAGAVAAGDTEDEPFMYSRPFQDLDGHLWNVLFMEPDKMPA